MLLSFKSFFHTFYEHTHFLSQTGCKWVELCFVCLKTTRSELVFLKSYLVSALQDDPVRSCQRNREKQTGFTQTFTLFHLSLLCLCERDSQQMPKPPSGLCVMNEAIEGRRHWFTCRPLSGQTWQRQRNVQGTVRTSCFLLRPEARSLPERLFNQPNSLGISYKPKQSADWSSGVCERSVFDRWVCAVLAAWIISVAQNECPAGDAELSSSWDPSQQIRAHIREESRLAQPAQCERYRETYCVH